MKGTYLSDAELEGVSFQSWPDTPKPYKVRGVIEAEKSKRHVAICMTREEAEDVARQLISLLGLRLTAVETGSS